MIICTKCGTHNENHQEYCFNCHYRFSINNASQSTTRVIQSNVRQIPNGNLSYPDNNSVIAEAYPEQDSGLEDLIERNFQQQKRHQQDVVTEAASPSAAPGTAAGQAPRSAKNGIKVLAIVLSVVILLTAGAALFFFIESDSPVIPNSALFAEAENLYHSGEYATALSKYSQFVNNHPDNALTELASVKIDEIKKIQAALGNENLPEEAVAEERVEAGLTTEQLAQISGLMRKAKTAYLRKQYLTPEEGNAIFYISQILSIDSGHADALEIRSKIVDFYRQKADAAVEDEAYRIAYKYYKNILKISPRNSHAKKQINKIPRKHRKL